MVEYRAEDLDRTFTALSDQTRRDILNRLALGASSVTELAEPYEMSLNAVSKHLKVLEQAGLVSRTVEGRVHRLELNAAPLRDAEEWVARYRSFWEARLDALEQFLIAKKRKERRHAGNRHKSKS
jgi:DNA-binding transcriptional ArsR family regulator